jgi:glutaredoxin
MLTVYSKKICPFCVNAKNYLKNNNIPFEEINVEQDPDAREFITSQGHRTVPQIYHNGKLFVEGGWAGLSKLSADDIKMRLGTTENLGTL